MIKRTTLATGLVLIAAPAALAATPTRQHARAYSRAYRSVARRYGHRAPGRNILRWGIDGRLATDAQIVASLSVLERMLVPVSSVPQAYTQDTPAQNAAGSQAVGSTYSATGGLEACIIQRESGGNPQAVNGQYEGIAQWSPSSWAGGGGTRYSATPLGASYAQQEAVLSSMLAAGQAGQWRPYDGC